jgi:hypothetical protein
MKSNVFSIMKRIFNFYGSKISDSSIRKIIHTHNKIYFKYSKRSLPENLNIGGREQSTFRKGIAGEWRVLYNQELMDYVKTYSAQTLINSGYEKDINW